MLAKGFLVQFAVSGERQTVEQMNLFRDLVLGQSAFAVAQQRFQVQLGAGIGDHERRHRFAPVRVGQADHRHLADTGVRLDGVLHLRGVHVHAAADDHVVLAVQQIQVTVRVHPSDVAGVQPAVHQRFGAFLRQAVITEHVVWRASRHFAAFTRGHRFSVAIDDTDLAHGRGLAATEQPLRMGRIVVLPAQPGDEVGRFRLAVQLHEHRTEGFQALSQTLHRDRGGAVQHGAQRTQIRTGLRIGLQPVQQPVNHGGYHEGESDLVLADAADHGGGIESGFDVVGGPFQQPDHQDAPGGMGQRRGEQKALVVLQCQLHLMGKQVQINVFLAVQDALGLARGAAGVGNEGQIIRCHVDVGVLRLAGGEKIIPGHHVRRAIPRRPERDHLFQLRQAIAVAGEQLETLSIDDGHPGVGVGQNIEHFVVAKHAVQRHPGGAGLNQPLGRHRELQAIGHGERYPGARSDAELDEGVADLKAAALQLGITEVAAPHG